MYIDDIQQAIDRCPRQHLLHLPTPLQPLDRLRRQIGGPRIWIKRDDLTGLAFGGNKSRYLEFTLAEALAQGADAVVLSAVVHSNHCRQFAAAAARLGLQAVVVLREDDSAMGRTDPITGNYLLNRLFGARIRLAPAADINAVVAEEMDRLRAAGRRPFTGLSAVLSRVAYIQCSLELSVQCQAQDIRPAAIVIGSGTNSLAGLLAGFALLDTDVTFVGTPQSHLQDPAHAAQHVVRAAMEAIEHLDLRCPAPPQVAQVRVDDSFVGTGFGHLDPPTRDSIHLLARTEGLLVDPAYTGKAFHALLDGVRRGLWPDDGDVLFVHTGGTPALFTYGADLLAANGA
ncbi:MAG: D-cysteine desulfhydrase family protein [bacterium]|nr:D-cysteine desulfhydrase family protein [bacterium]